MLVDTPPVVGNTQSQGQHRTMTNPPDQVYLCRRYLANTVRFHVAMFVQIPCIALVFFLCFGRSLVGLSIRRGGLMHKTFSLRSFLFHRLGLCGKL